MDSLEYVFESLLGANDLSLKKKDELKKLKYIL